MRRLKPMIAHAPANLPTVKSFVLEDFSQTILRAALQPFAGSAEVIVRGTINDAITHFTAAPAPRLVIVDLSNTELALGLVEQLIDLLGPDIRVIALGHINDIGFYRALQLLGVSDYMVKPVALPLLNQCLQRALSDEPIVNAQSNRLGRLLTVTGARGGVGATTIALNLAWWMAIKMQRRVALIDFDFLAGDIRLHLNLTGPAGLIDVLRQPERLDSVLLERAMSMIEARLAILTAPDSIDGDFIPTPAALERLLTLLRQHYDYIVLDAPRYDPGLLRYLHAESDHHLIVAEPTLSAVRQAMQIVNDCTHAPQQSGSLPTLILNRVGLFPRTGLNRQTIDELLGTIPVHEMGFERRIIEAANLGIPAASRAKDFAIEIARVAAALCGDGRVPAPAKSKFRWR